MIENTVLNTKLVGDIEGEFFIPSYQRGYRWEKQHIKMLLKDISENGDSNYCLQPIVVRKKDNKEYELIDGQQRLTTIYLILKYMKGKMPELINHKFTLTYETRKKSKEFLDSLDENKKDENIDFFHIFNAFQTIKAWFEEGSNDALKVINIYKYLGENVKVIWYEINNIREPIELFTRLNIGKIPLTNSELVRALFLSNDNSNLAKEKQLEIATSWDLIEKELHNESLCSFLTNEDLRLYQTRIELVFNMISNKPKDDKEKFFTFFYFNNQLINKSKVDLWKEIEEFYFILKEWFQNRDIYHKVGFLVSRGQQIINLKKETEYLTKSEFQNYLDKKIINFLNLTKEDIYNLSYENSKDKKQIENLLLLFNVETTRLLKDSREKYPFNYHKQKQWSLEHIHAQNSEGLNKKADQQNWLDLHKKSLDKLSCKDIKKQKEIKKLLDDIDKYYEDINYEKFDEIFNRVTNFLSDEKDKSYIDMVSNMALLSMENNSALNNSTFDVKRDKIIEMDKNGEYIPICTRNVFLKYYSESANTKLQFWSENDRNSYLDSMIGDKGLILKYLKNTTDKGDVNE